eukprot:scaffold25738_cov18-Prasinocladus_malaysianus.AAC.1
MYAQVKPRHLRGLPKYCLSTNKHPERWAEWPPEAAANDCRSTATAYEKLHSAAGLSIPGLTIMQGPEQYHASIEMTGHDTLRFHSRYTETCRIQVRQLWTTQFHAISFSRNRFNQQSACHQLKKIAEVTSKAPKLMDDDEVVG